MSAYKYRIQWSLGDPLFNSPTTENDTEQSYWTPRGGFADGTYYWRVAMIDGNGKLGGYSNAVFTKQYPIAKPLAPVNGSTIHATPTFTWTAADGVTPYVFGAASYRLEISQFPTFVPLYDSVTTVNTSFVPSKIYDINKTYYWRVAIVDLNGKLGPFSNATIIIKTNAFYCYLPITRH